MSQKLKLLFIPLLICLAVFLFIKFDIRSQFVLLLENINRLGWAGMLIFGSVYILACVLLLPGSVLTLGAGFVYKLAVGTALVSAASTAGASVAFLIGRHIARDWVSEKLKSYPRFRAIDRAVGEQGWKIVGLTRLSPVFPFNLLNYAYGLTSVRFSEYVLASWIGMLPGTVMYVYFGSLAGDLATLGQNTDSTGKIVLTLVGFAATVAVTVMITRIARRALEVQIGASDAEV